jgi:hypothetical protein
LTTIVFKNGILAADTRTIKRTITRDACLECGSKLCGRDGTPKLLIAVGKGKTEAKFRKQTVVALASAGSSVWCTIMRDVMRDGGDIEVFNNHVNRLLAADDNQILGTAIIVTREKIFLHNPKIPHEADRTKEFPLDTDVVLAFGSGGPFAYAAAFAGQLDAVQAVGVAGQCDKATSQTVEWVDCRLEAPELQTQSFKGILPVRYSVRS